MRRPPPRASHIRVVVFRHGPAEVRDPGRWPDDDERPLTGKGRVQTRRAARGIARLLPSVDRIATSPADRAVTTAELLRQALRAEREVEPWEELGTGRLAEPIFARLARSVRAGETVALVGHDPTLTEFVGFAMVGEGVGLVRLGKGGAALLDFPARLVPGAGRLLWLLTRKQLSAVRD